MKAAGICFTKNGLRLFRALSELWPEGRWYAKGKSLREGLGADVTFVEGGADALHSWTKERFADSDLLVFVGAAGIAVRAVAPFVADKKTDPAVLCLDETGKFCIPLLAGHIGGANEAAELIAKKTGAVPVITTATDLRGKFAVDVFATKNDLGIADMELAKDVAACLVDGGTVDFFSEHPVFGDLPGGLRLLTKEAWEERMSDDEGSGENPLCVCVGIRRLPKGATRVLHLLPRAVTLGIGCRKGATAGQIAAHVDRVLAENNIHPAAVRQAVTIDVKKEEPGLLAFCEERGWPLLCFSAEELAETEGDFTASSFVESQVGVDNVCERGAARAGGKLIVKKTSADGVTCAAAEKERVLRF